ncbi:MAG: TetR/AcrR family transcriptional regulator [Burkholderiales bacterium]
MSTKQYAKGVTTQASILMAARLCFAKKGFFETSMTDIEVAANTSRGVIYHHFKNKEDMIQRITQENLGSMADKIASNLERLRAEGGGDLRQILSNLMNLTEAITFGPGRAMSVHVWSLALLNPNVYKTLEACFERIRLLLKSELLALQAKGKYPADADLDRLSTALFSVQIPGFIVQRLLLGEHSLKPDDFIDAMVKLFAPKATDVKTKRLK